MTFKLIKQLEVKNTLGEGVIWDHHNQCVWWTDILENKVYHWHFEKGLSIFSVPEPLCSFGLTKTPGQFIAAFASGFAFYTPETSEVKWLCKVEEHYPENRMNDGKVDRQGRFWAGSMRQRGHGPLGALYCLEKTRVSCRLKDISISNGLSWSPDAKHMYFADSPTGVIRRFDFEPETGLPGQSYDFAKSPQGASPDGSCIDSEGYLWNAQWGAGKVVRYDTQGNEVLILDVPCLQPTCVAFGGPELNHLFVTSACEGLGHQRLSSQPANGNLFVFETPYKGLVEPEFVH